MVVYVYSLQVYIYEERAYLQIAPEKNDWSNSWELPRLDDPFHLGSPVLPQAQGRCSDGCLQSQKALCEPALWPLPDILCYSSAHLANCLLA